MEGPSSTQSLLGVGYAYTSAMWGNLGAGPETPSSRKVFKRGEGSPTLPEDHGRNQACVHQEGLEKAGVHAELGFGVQQMNMGT